MRTRRPRDPASIASLLRQPPRKTFARNSRVNARKRSRDSGALKPAAPPEFSPRNHRVNARWPGRVFSSLADARSPLHKHLPPRVNGGGWGR